MKIKSMVLLFVLVLLLTGCKEKQEPRDTEELHTCITQIVESNTIDGCINAYGKFNDYIEQYFIRFDETITIDNTTITFSPESDLLYFYIIFDAPDSDLGVAYTELETMYNNILEDLANASEATIWLGLQFNHGSDSHKMTLSHKDMNLYEDEVIVYISTMSEIEDVYTSYLSWLEDVAVSKQFRKAVFNVTGFDHTFELTVYPEEETYLYATTQLQSNTRLSANDLRDSLINRLPSSYTETQ